MSSEAGTDELQVSLPTSTILWFYIRVYICVQICMYTFRAFDYSILFYAIQIILFNTHYCVGINTVILLSVLSLVPPSLRQNLVRKKEGKKVSHKGM